MHIGKSGTFLFNLSC
jgi:hypothetical protein